MTVIIAQFLALRRVGHGGGGAGGGSDTGWMGGKQPPAGETLPNNQRPAGIRDGYETITYLGPE